MTVTLDKFGRVLIPKLLRDQLGLVPGAELSLDVHEGDGGPALELRAVPDASDPDGGLVYVNGRLVHNGRIGPAGQDVVAFIKSQRDARTLRLAGLDPDAR